MSRARALLVGWSGEHDGCPLHGHATDQSKATAGCTCARHRKAGEAIELLGLVDAEFRSDPTSVQCFDLRIVERIRKLVAR